MPTAPRPNKKAKKIAYDILGVPANQQDKKNYKRRKVNQQLIKIDTALVK